MNVKYIGMDVHKEAISIAVMNGEGKLVMESIIETKASTILQFIQGLRGDLHVTFEEGTWAAWLYDLLKPHVTELVVCERAHSVDEDPVAEVCRQFGLSRESFYQIQQAFQELGFSSFQSRKRGRKGPVKLSGELLKFALAQKKESPTIDPGHLAALIQERYGIAIHRTTVLRGLKKNTARDDAAPRLAAPHS